MSYRSIVISNTARLNHRDNNLVVNQENEEVKIPLEDISTILIDNAQSTITTSLLSKVNQYGISVITTDDKHLPSGILLPLNQHYQSLERFNKQLNQTEPFKKRLWQKIIISKIKNQSLCLKYSNFERESNYLEKLSKNVESGDKTHLEGVAAKYYFNCLFGKEFKRDQDIVINAGLNYGYSIIRSSIARELVSYGLNPIIGINHCNQYNNFNLADDFIEPFRPLVDLWVNKNLKGKVSFESDDKYKLVELINYEIGYNDQITSVSNTIKETIKSYTTTLIRNNYKKLILPSLLDLDLYYYE